MMRIDEVGKTSIIQTGEINRQSTPVQKQSGGNGFKQVFNEALTGSSNLKFSQHALDRLSRRGVDIDGQTVSRLDNAITAAGKKGAGQSLVLLDEMAFLVSVKNRTVITAMETSKMKEGVFTQIDSAVIG
jgi:flagellar operon protein